MILDTFNKIVHKENQDTYIGGLIKLQAIYRKRPRMYSNSKPKSVSRSYKFRIANVEKCVCVQNHFVLYLKLKKAESNE